MSAFRLLSLSVLFALSATVHADPLQNRIDSAFEKIMNTKLGLEICDQILGSDAEAIRFHLGVSAPAAKQIATNCFHVTHTDSWIASTSYKDIRKLNLNPRRGRAYQVVEGDAKSPIESWTDPLSNTTTLLAGKGGLSESRLIQLLAHETGVYFDSKLDPLHPDAQHIDQLRHLQISGDPQLPPMVVAMDPLVSNALVFVRALQVEFAIVGELVDQHKMDPPSDYNDSYLRRLVSVQCGEDCVEDLIERFRSEFLPISAPLLAFAPRFRKEIPDALSQLELNWDDSQWGAMQATLNTDPSRFIEHRFKGNPLNNIEKVFRAPDEDVKQYQDASAFLNNIWPIEKQSLLATRVGSEPILVFLKRPLLSGYNILLSAGPRARVRTGGTE